MHVYKQAHDKRDIAESLHVYIYRAIVSEGHITSIGLVSEGHILHVYIYRASIRGAYFERKIATLKNMPIPLF